MTSKLLLSALAAVAAIAVVAAPQDPSFEYPGAKHVGFDQGNDAPQTPEAPQQERSGRVSVTFTDATVREVLDWLKNQGVSFVVTDQQVDKDSHVSINVSERSISSVMEALGEAWGGHWDRKGDIWVFQKGGTAWAPAIAGGVTAPAFPKGAPAAPQFQLAPGDARVFMQPGPMTKEQREAFEKSFKEMNDPKKWDEFNKNMDEWSKSWDAKSLGELEKQGKVFRYEMKPGAHGFTWDGKEFKPLDEKQMKELEEHMRTAMKAHAMTEEQMKELGKQGKVFRYELKPGEHGIVWNGDASKPFDEKQMKELEKRAAELAERGVTLRLDGEKMAKLNEEQRKAIEKQVREMAKLAPAAPGAQSFTFTVPEAKPLTEQQIKELEKAGKVRVLRPGAPSVLYGKPLTPKAMKEWEKQHGITIVRSGRGSSTAVASSHNLKAIYDLLTPTQIEKQQRLGYINYSDLNSKQRSLLGVITDDNWTISYKTDKANLTIKSDR